MEKQLSTIDWLGLICTLLALIFRTLVVFGINPTYLGANGGIGISSTSFFHGAALFSSIARASALPISAYRIASSPVGALCLCDRKEGRKEGEFSQLQVR